MSKCTYKDRASGLIGRKGNRGDLWYLASPLFCRVSLPKENINPPSKSATGGAERLSAEEISQFCALSFWRNDSLFNSSERAVWLKSNFSIRSVYRWTHIFILWASRGHCSVQSMVYSHVDISPPPTVFSQCYWFLCITDWTNAEIITRQLQRTVAISTRVLLSL